MSNGPPFYCPHCGAGPFNTRDEMRKHIYDVHLKEGKRLLLAQAPTTFLIHGKEVRVHGSM